MFLRCIKKWLSDKISAIFFIRGSYSNLKPNSWSLKDHRWIRVAGFEQEVSKT